MIFLISQLKHVLTPLQDSSNDGSQHVLKETYGKLPLNYPFYPFLHVSGALD